LRIEVRPITLGLELGLGIGVYRSEVSGFKK